MFGSQRNCGWIPDWEPIHFLYNATTPAMRPFQPPIQRIQQTLSPEIKQPVNDSDHTLQVGQSPQSSARLRMGVSTASL
jgi:hypothetical protein